MEVVELGSSWDSDINPAVWISLLYAMEIIIRGNSRAWKRLGL